jgi:hypothetical protein
LEPERFADAREYLDRISRERRDQACCRFVTETG